jgi:hypothetical protein
LKEPASSQRHVDGNFGGLGLQPHSNCLSPRFAGVGVGRVALGPSGFDAGVGAYYAAPERGALRRLERDYPETPYVFVSERQAPLTADTVRKIVARAGQHAGIQFPIHPHMLRHATGYKLANDGQDTRAIQHYLGHRNIQHTTRYTELAADRLKSFW